MLYTILTMHAAKAGAQQKAPFHTMTLLLPFAAPRIFDMYHVTTSTSSTADLQQFGTIDYSIL